MAHAAPPDDRAIRDHVIRLLDWEEAHVGFDAAVDGLPVAHRAACASGFEHSPWQLVEHMRLAQDDIYDFCVDAAYAHRLEWPGDYWPGPTPPDDAAWQQSLAAFAATRDRLKTLARDVDDLTARVPTGNERQTYLRALLLVADHTSYHVGQLVAVRRALGSWPGR